MLNKILRDNGENQGVEEKNKQWAKSRSVKIKESLLLNLINPQSLGNCVCKLGKDISNMLDDNHTFAITALFSSLIIGAAWINNEQIATAVHQVKFKGEPLGEWQMKVTRKGPGFDKSTLSFEQLEKLKATLDIQSTPTSNIHL